MNKRVFAAAAGAFCMAVAGLYWSASAGAATTVTVRSGDTLWGLARRYHTTVAALATANDMVPSDLLLVGRVLYVPDSTTIEPGNLGSAVDRDKTGDSSQWSTATSSDRLPRYADPQGFCSSYSPSSAEAGVLPPALAASPARLALRPIFVEWASYYRVSPALVEAVAWQESGWQEGVVSPVGAVGIGQIMPSTAEFEARILGVHLRVDLVSDNIRLMAGFVSYLRSMTGNDCAAAASYYEGLGSYQSHGVLPVAQPYVADVLTLEQRFSG